MDKLGLCGYVHYSEGLAAPSRRTLPAAPRQRSHTSNQNCNQPLSIARAAATLPRKRTVPPERLCCPHQVCSDGNSIA